MPHSLLHTYILIFSFSFLFFLAFLIVFLFSYWLHEMLICSLEANCRKFKCLVCQEVQEIQVGPLGWGDPLEWEMATCSTVLAWETPWTEEPGRLQSMELQRVRHD